MALRFSCGSHQSKHLSRAVQTMSKIGNEITLDARPERMVLRCLNDTRTAYVSVAFLVDFFDQYKMQDVESVQTGLPIKSFWSVFKNVKIDRMDVELGDKATRMDVVVSCQNGLKKSYGVLCIDTDVLCSSMHRESLPNSLLADAKEFSRILAHFDTQLDEVSIVALPEEEARRTGGTTLQIRSFIDYEMSAWENTLQTCIAMDAKDMLEEFKHSSPHVFEATLNRSDFKAMVVYCELIGAHVRMFYDRPGVPVFVVAEFPDGNGIDRLVEAELMLSTQHEVEEHPVDIAPMPQMENFEHTRAFTNAKSRGNKRKNLDDGITTGHSKNIVNTEFARQTEDYHQTEDSEDEELPATPPAERTPFL